MWRHAWVSSIDKWNAEMPQPFCLAQNWGEGLIAYGTREWDDYSVTCCRFMIHLGTAGILIRVQGLRRYYALRFHINNRVSLVRVMDDAREELDSVPYEWKVEKPYQLHIAVQGDKISAAIEGGPSLAATDRTYSNGAFGLLVHEGSASATEFRIE